MTPASRARLWGFLAGTAVAAALVVGLVAVTTAAPRTFLSVARLDLGPSGVGVASSGARDLRPEIEILRSKDLLLPVIHELDLTRTWSEAHRAEGTLQTLETYELLASRLEVHPLRNSSLVEIRVFDADPELAATLANAIVEAYLRRQRSSPTGNPPAARLIDRAVPGLRPVRPNVAMNISLGTALALAFGAVAGGGLARALSPRRSTTPPRL